jgi:hypothetical protein
MPEQQKQISSRTQGLIKLFDFLKSKGYFGEFKNYREYVERNNLVQVREVNGQTASFAGDTKSSKACAKKPRPMFGYDD